MNIKKTILLFILLSTMATYTIYSVDVPENNEKHAVAVEYFHVMAQRDMSQLLGVLARLLKNNIKDCGSLAISPHFWQRVWTICFSKNKERTGSQKVEKLCEEFPSLENFKETIENISVDHWKLIPENYELFKQIKQERLELLLILIAPMGSEWLKRVKKTKSQIPELFEHFIIPDTNGDSSEQFNALLEHHGLNKENLLVIVEDNQQAEDEARAAGATQIVRYSNHQNLVESLKEHRIK